MTPIPQLYSKPKGSKKNKNKNKNVNEVIVTTDVVSKIPTKNQQRNFRRRVRAKSSLAGSSMNGLVATLKCIEHTPSTRAGIAMVKAMINPCGEGPLLDYAGITDGGGVSSAPVKMRDDLLFGPPSFAETGEGWGCVIYDTPYFASQLIIFRYLTVSGIPSQDDIRLTVNAITNVQWDTSARYPNFFRPTEQISLAGVITPYTGPPFEITNLVPAALQGRFGSQTGAANPGWAEIRKWRYGYKGHTCHLNAPDLANEGRIIQSLTSTESSVKTIGLPPSASNLNTSIACRFTVSPPFEDNILAMQDTQARQDIFKKGSYAVQRSWNKVMVWNEAEDVRPIIRVPDAATIGVNFQLPEVAALKVDGFDMNMGWIVENIRGLNYAAEVHIKFRSCLLVSVVGSSPWAAFMVDAPEEDTGATNLLYKLATLLPHTYEACFNDMGFLGGIISKVLGTVTGALPKVLGLGAKFLHGLVDKGEAYANNQLQKYSSYGGPGEYGDRGLVR
jgi:hypothetical protein